MAGVSEGAVEYLAFNNIVQYASEDMMLILMAKVDGRRKDFLQQVEELPHFAQAWES